MKYNISFYHNAKVQFGSFNQEIEERFKFKKLYNKFVSRLMDYDFIFSYTNYYSLEKEEILYPNTISKQICIFCLKDEGQTTFGNKPHVIPYFLGNKYLLHSGECDECNAYFSKSLEDALDKYTAPFRTLSLMKNRRKKLTKFTSNKGDFIYAYNRSQNAFTMSGENLNSYVYDDENGILQITFDLKRHRPVEVYKAFMKIFYGLLPREEHKKFTELRSWIMNKNASKFIAKPLQVIRSWYPSFTTMPLTIFILRRKSSLELEPNSFDYSGLISFGNVVYEMPIFSDAFLENAKKLQSEGKSLNFTLQLLPKPFPTIHSEMIDFSNPEYITDKYEINFKYKDRITNI
ncbi:HNH endonuclease [Acinetobacter baumannii]|uniref:HNH endonuclease n=1 Tax=Acinetobacter baumannii TaxID=470 RepID=UPI0002BA8684|nr:HNH endonuclease [Acinetobacter baumannii]MDC4334572.1 HNH endonuclease [Acinetobacter baumannii]MDC4771934.1 HNH endonuclease [Acinetobacter baumannii]HCE0841722.1 hypothetical protein [Acinetobacter baumannii]